MSNDVSGPRTGRPRNYILSRMPEEQFQALSRHLTPVDLPLNLRLSVPLRPAEFLYFPVSGLISTEALTEKGESVEVGLTGREGFSGLCGLLGHSQISHSVMMQGSGSGFRIRTSVMREEFLKGGALAQLVYDFTHMQMAQMTQSVLCNRLHQVDERLARWLLTSADRLLSEELTLTQEFLAQMLGSRRSTVTVAAGDLQRQGAIDYSRGRIRITDRKLLLSKVCECYSIVQSVYDRVLGADFARTMQPVSPGNATRS